MYVFIYIYIYIHIYISIIFGYILYYKLRPPVISWLLPWRIMPAADKNLGIGDNMGQPRSPGLLSTNRGSQAAGADVRKLVLPAKFLCAASGNMFFLGADMDIWDMYGYVTIQIWFL
jgi:hypothetical protein